MRVVLLAVLLLVARVGAVAAQRHAVSKASSTGNHTTSSDSRRRTYTLKDLREGKPLAVTLKRHSSDSDKSITSPLQNPINVTISDDHGQEVKCEFTRLNNVCFLKEVKSISATKVTYAFC